MALRSGHGNGAGTPRVEVLPPVHDSGARLPRGVRAAQPAPARMAEGAPERACEGPRGQCEPRGRCDRRVRRVALRRRRSTRVRGTRTSTRRSSAHRAALRGSRRRALPPSARLTLRSGVSIGVSIGEHSTIGDHCVPNGIRRRGRHNGPQRCATIRNVRAMVRGSHRCVTLRNVTRWTIPWTNRATPDGSRRKRWWG
jgi:hypothetical protein